jgi:DNA polymerase-3 subunit delta'
MLYPWQENQWQYLLQLKQRMPHALLLHGSAGIGKLALAHEYAQASLCESPQENGHACGTCKACNWYAQGSHPDFRLLEPESLTEQPGAEEKQSSKKSSTIISVAQVRELADFVNLSTHRHGMRVILIHPAETMNPQAANSLLKILEEPAPNTLFILISHQSQRLLPTVRSRCHKIEFPLPANDVALRWLEGQGVVESAACLAQAGRAPLRALALNDTEYQSQRKAFLGEIANPEKLEALVVAEKNAKTGLPDIVEWLQKWTHDLTRLKMGASIQYQPDWETSLRGLEKKVNLSRLLDFQRELLTVRRALHHPLNSQLVLEKLLLNYSNILTEESVHG